MSLLNWDATGVETYRECRHCGQAVEDPADACPACGATTIAEYEL